MKDYGFYFGVIAALFSTAYSNSETTLTAAEVRAVESCSNCEYDQQVIQDSPSVTVFTKDARIVPGQPANFYFQFRNPNGKEAVIEVEASAGEFTSSYEDIEAQGKVARSTSPRDNNSWPAHIGATFSTNVVMWMLQWTPPGSVEGDIAHFRISVRESGGEALGADRLHLKLAPVPIARDSLLLPALR